MREAPTKPFGMPSPMGEVMATLLLIVDAWFELARDAAPDRFVAADRVEVLGQLVRLVAHRFHGFRYLPRHDDLKPVLSQASVGLYVRSPARPPLGGASIEQQLAKYGFIIESVTAGTNREILVTCHNLAGAQILAFPDSRALASRRKRRR